MSVFNNISNIVDVILTELKADGVLPEEANWRSAVVEPPRDPSHGDLASNAAMVLARQAKMSPRDLAGHIVPRLQEAPAISEASIAGPGFINLRLDPAVWLAEITQTLQAGGDCGRSQLGGDRRVNVEYVSANPTGPLHVGHVRGAVFGDALASLLAYTGHQVTREYYINDAGAQVDVLARSAYLRYREALGEDIGDIPEGLYPGEYLKPVGTALADKFGRDLLGKPEPDWLEPVRRFAIDAMMDLIRADLGAVSIHHEVFFAESSLHGGNGGKVGETIDMLRDRGLVYDGRLEAPKGISKRDQSDWEDRVQTLFRTKQAGDDTDRPLMKSDGSYTYFASDVAYFLDKHQRGFDHVIYILGADHGGYVKRLEAVARAIAGDATTIRVMLCQLVRLLRDGNPVKMSKRSGSFITLREVVDEVGSDVLRFIMLTRKNDAQLDFDFSKVTEQTRDNPVFYVQYAHARIASVMRNAARDMPGLDLSDAALAASDPAILTDPSEIGLAMKVAEFPRIIEQAAIAHEPHRIAFYLYDLAGAFHTHWNRGKENEKLRFLVSGNIPLTIGRLSLIRSVGVVIAAGLELLGVTPVEEMH